MRSRPGIGATMARASRRRQIDRRVDERQVGQGLREVADQLDAVSGE
jgi:hypothetical protein